MIKVSEKNPVVRVFLVVLTLFFICGPLIFAYSKTSLPSIQSIINSAKTVNSQEINILTPKVLESGFFQTPFFTVIKKPILSILMPWLSMDRLRMANIAAK